MILTKNILMYSLSDNDNLLINTMSGAFDIVDNQTRRKIENIGDIQKNDINDNYLIDTLRKRGYIYDTIEDEINTINKYRKVNNTITEMRQKNNFTICPTMGCNLRCTYCFESDELHKDVKIMTRKQIETILHYIYININKKQPPLISLFGGEPLLKINYEIVEKILKFAKEQKLMVRIITNGTTIKFYEELLLKYYEIIMIQITLDGDKKTHNKRRIRADGTGSFDEVCNSIEKLIKLNIKTSIRINVDKENINSIDKLINFIKEKKWNEAKNILTYVAPVQDFCISSDTTFKENELFSQITSKYPYIGETNSIIQKIVAPVISYLDMFLDLNIKMKPWKIDYCEATSGKSIIFTPDGNISTCLSMAGKNKYIIGKFNEKEVEFDEYATKLWFDRSVFRIPKCKDCKFCFICGGGCPVAAIEVNKDIDCPVCSDIEKTLQVYIDTIKNKILNQCKN
ncbi:radical SAM/SPASM domain-containing protein [Clostridium saccharoperbutylacetonicum]|uniref:radical SAM/SPASM domain-containing protein n=1 Tax=Clostridium saccharoperbutylacetonicum TaxID=36745 RepID=UPI0009839F1E|nr:radical SAM protein [Clostridium saccharoperbutylacetonicum]AQR98088.1 hypothetical protein CLSAP_54390 [Clostridium saccharoperbutylacetonicum]NSB33981.1 uncharacterized protein [Clostridium saccharoperbutylacetonicum]